MITEESKVETEPTGSAGENGTTGEIEWDLVRWAVVYLIMDYVVRGVSLIPGLPRDIMSMLGVGLSFGLFSYVLSKERWLRPDLGLTWKQNPGSLLWSFACVAVLLAVGVYGGVIRTVETWSPLVNLHTVVASPIAEELAYRGVALAALCCAFGSRGALWPLLITSAIGVWAHAPIRDAGIWADVWRISYFFSIGVIQGAMRLKSGSLLFPVIGHMALNGAIAVGFLLRR